MNKLATMLGTHSITSRAGAGFLLVVALSSGAVTEPVRFTSEPAAKPPTGEVSVIDARTAWVGLTTTEDGGRSWTARLPPASNSREFVDGPAYGQGTFFLTASQGWLTGRDSVWATGDGGQTWRPQVRGHIYGIAFVGDAGWMAAGDIRSVQNYVSRDHGQSWNSCGAPWRPSELAPLGAASFLGPRDGWITVATYDSRGRQVIDGVARTSDGGCTWETLWRQRLGHWENLTDIKFVDNRFGWLTATYGRLLKTSDGGKRWQPVDMPAEGVNLESSYLVDRMHGWITGGAPRGSGLYYTRDGGEHWAAVSKAEVIARRGLGRQIPVLWGAAFLVRLAWNVDAPE